MLRLRLRGIMNAMDDKQRAFWAKLCALPIDGGPTTHGFADRLACEHGWSRSYAMRAIDEYRRFLFLAREAGHPVSPSEVVDHVWHQHLLYSRSYWHELCNAVLERPLHHEPSQGGLEESAKFAEWYAATLASYERFFGEKPDARFWPASNAPARGQRWISLNEVWMLPRPHRRVVQATAVVLLLIVLVVSASVAMAQGSPPTWGIEGQSFLLFYGGAGLGVFLVALMVRWMLRRGPIDAYLRTMVEDTRRDSAKRLSDPYLAAYLHEGEWCVMQTALASLVGQGFIEVQSDGSVGLKRSSEEELSRMRTLERLICECVTESPKHISRVMADAYVQIAVRRVASAAQDAGLVLTDAQASAARLLPSLLWCAFLTFGAARLLSGIHAGKPVLLLVAELLLFGIVGLVVLLRKPRRTHAGDRWHDQLKKTYVDKRNNWVITEDMQSLPWMVGVFGVGVLAGTELHALSDSLTRHAKSQQVASSGWFSGWGWGCGGGSSCGGGGCGGGCGGCGGCGG